ncbi:hypothetical protein KQX54_018293 [Cotesia glomerata]|uniref:Uncharacterized protein n=1 Tax=Cotesia glomerata TaxID=32391 RepID=A0AAV7J997_COTGL|nr:hypothetical protein KQX54_018293 [Cotesia glomerata]
MLTQVNVMPGQLSKSFKHKEYGALKEITFLHAWILPHENASIGKPFTGLYEVLKFVGWQGLEEQQTLNERSGKVDFTSHGVICRALKNCPLGDYGERCRELDECILYLFSTSKCIYSNGDNTCVEEEEEEASCEHVRNDKRSNVPVGYVAFTLGNDLIPLDVFGEKNVLILSFVVLPSLEKPCV